MALSAGIRLGHYDVTSLLGEGGMGQRSQKTGVRRRPPRTRVSRNARIVPPAR